VLAREGPIVPANSDPLVEDRGNINRKNINMKPQLTLLNAIIARFFAFDGGHMDNTWLHAPLMSDGQPLQHFGFPDLLFGSSCSAAAPHLALLGKP
jgi:hypothetical protein